jgi:hypothetical protein
MFTRRLTQSETALWLRLDEPCPVLVPSIAVKKAMHLFAGLSDTLLYLSSVEDNAVGGTAAYRDSVTSTLSLVAVRMRPDSRKALLSPMIKSSLPFFRSTSIVGAEALVSQSRDGPRFPFPLTYELPKWVTPTLEAAGFQRAELLSHCSIEKLSYKQAAVHKFEWDAEPHLVGANELLRKEGKALGLDCSQVRLAVCMANGAGSLRTVSKSERTSVLVGFNAFGKHGLLTVFAYDPDLVEVNELEAAILSLCNEAKVRTLHLLLVGQGQKGFVGSLAEICRSSVETEDTQLMRKGL